MPRRYVAKRPRRPYKKRATRRMPIRRRTRRTIPRGLRQAVLPIQRDITHFVNSEAAELPTGWQFGTAGTHYNTIQCNQVFKLAMLDSTDEFTNLFKMYKLNCVVVTITPLHNTSQANGTATSSQVYYGGNIIMYAEKNLQGYALDSNIEQGYWDQTPAKKTYQLNGPRPKTFKIFPKILSPTYLTDTTTQTQSKQPGWLPTSTTGLEVPHYGINMQFTWVDPSMDFRRFGETITAAPMNFRVNYKFLMQFRGLN